MSVNTMNFREFLKDYNIPTAPEGHHHARPNWIQFDCPYCGRNVRRYHMGYSLEGNFVNCWKCGGHNLINTMMELTGLTYHQIKKIISDFPPTKFKKEKVTGKLVIPKGICELKPAHKKYLKNRNFDIALIQKRWHIKGMGIVPRLSWRIFIPIYYEGEVVSWTTRSIATEVKRRYISASEEEEAIPHKTLLYGEGYVRNSICIVEGPTDVWRIGPGAVATFGTGFSSKQIAKMIKYPRRVICYDNNPEAQKQAKKLYNHLSVLDGETFIVNLDSPDPGQAAPKEIKQLRKLIGE